MQFLPAADGHGGAQRAWFLLQALSRLAPVHLVVLQPARIHYYSDVDLSAVKDFAACVTVIPVEEWDAAWGWRSRLPKDLRRWLTLFRIGSVDAPALNVRTLADIASKLPDNPAELIFAGRLGPAIIADSLIEAGHLANTTKVVDLDDILSRVRVRGAVATRPIWRIDRLVRDMLEAGFLRVAEKRILAGWDAASVCSDGDGALLEKRRPQATVHCIPNVTTISHSPVASNPGTRILFVGNLSFAPNVDGLVRFLDLVWPRIVVAAPSATLVVVGMRPGDQLKRVLAARGVELHADVTSVQPFYEAADIVIAPIYFGGGTRVKVVEAMAAGRPVVSTSIGIEGLDVENGRHALVADRPNDFAFAVLSLIASPEDRARLARNARELQEARFQPSRLYNAVQAMIGSVEGLTLSPAAPRCAGSSRVERSASIRLRDRRKRAWTRNPRPFAGARACDW